MSQTKQQKPNQLEPALKRILGNEVTVILTGAEDCGSRGIVIQTPKGIVSFNAYCSRVQSHCTEPEKKWKVSFPFADETCVKQFDTKEAADLFVSKLGSAIAEKTEIKKFEV